MRSSRLTPALEYGIAALSVAVAAAVRHVVEPWLTGNVPYLLLLPAVIFSSWRGGLGPGLTATALSGLLLSGFYLRPVDSVGVEGLDDQASLGLFLLTGMAISALSQRLRDVSAALRHTAELAATRAERLDAVFDTTVDGIIVISERGLIESFNRGAERLFGYAAADVIGKNVSILMPSPHREAHDGYLQHYADTGRAQIIGVGRQVSGRRSDGTLFPVHLSVGEMWIGGVRKFTGMLHDLSARAALDEQLRSSEARWRAVISSAVDGIIVIGAHGVVESFNPAAERLFGYAASEVIGRNVNMLMPSPYREGHDGYLAHYRDTGEAKVIGIGREATGRRKDGSTFPLHLCVGEIKIEGETKFSGIVHDLSARVELETRLRDQAALAHLGEMAAVLAHEIKNPLGGIRGAVELVTADLGTTHRNADLLEDAKGRIDALDRLLRELLLFARPPQPRADPVDLNSLLATSVRLSRGDSAFHQVEFEMRGRAPVVSGDPQMLELVFHNLLINAAHAMNGHGRIRIDLDSQPGVGQVTITDTGPGIPTELRDKVFTPFFTTKIHGSGLGLATARRFVEAQHGHIWVTGAQDRGAAIVVTLPTAP